MENFPSELDMKNLVDELKQGREMAVQLQIHLHNVHSSLHKTHHEFLLHKILNSYDKALSILKHIGLVDGVVGGEMPPPFAVATSLDPKSHIESPQSYDSDQEFKYQASKKRKSVPTWTQNVQVLLCPAGTGSEGQLDDGNGWRKYGQKDILGAKYPRGYYRCTYRHGQGCLATKQVQRSDKDPTIFEITYKGNHTCNPCGISNNDNPSIPIPDQQNQDPNSLPEYPPQFVLQPQQNQQLEPLFHIQTNVGVITQDLDNNPNSLFEPYNFPSTSRDNPKINQVLLDGNNFLVNNSPNLMPPSVVNNNCEGLMNILQNLEHELDENVVITTSATNTHIYDPNLPFGSPGSGSTFSFRGYFP